jgi:hypothetical protein
MMRTVDFVPVCETAILADNDVFFVPIQVPGCFKAGEPAKLIFVQVVDTDDQGTDFDLFFYNDSATLGTLNAAVTINDTDAAKAIGFVSMTAAANGVDNVNSWLFTKFLDEGIPMTPVDGSSSVWVGGVVRSGTPTYTATGMKIKLGFE